METGLADGSGEGGETKDKHRLGLELGRRRKQNRLYLESRTPSRPGLWTLSYMPSIYGNDIPIGKPGPRKEEPQGSYLASLLPQGSYLDSPRRKEYPNYLCNRIESYILLCLLGYDHRPIDNRPLPRLKAYESRVDFDAIFLFPLFRLVSGKLVHLGYTGFRKNWSGSLAKRRLCLVSAGVINCTPLSALSSE